MTPQKTKLWRVHAEKIAEDVLAEPGTTLSLARMMEIIAETVELVEDDPNFSVSNGVVVKLSDWNLQEKFFVVESGLLSELLDRIIIECDTSDSDAMSDAWSWFTDEHLFNEKGGPGTRARMLEAVTAEEMAEALFLDYNNPRESVLEIKEEL